MNRLERIRGILEALDPKILEIKDESAAHHGHLESPDAEYTHIRINISDIFADMKLVEKHRRIKDLLKSEFQTGLHALSINLK